MINLISNIYKTILLDYSGEKILIMICILIKRIIKKTSNFIPGFTIKQNPELIICHTYKPNDLIEKLNE